MRIPRLLAVIDAWRRLASTWRLRRDIGHLGASAYAVSRILVMGGQNIVVGERFTSSGPAYLRAVSGCVHIGKRASLNANCVIDGSHGEVRIGDDFLGGPGVVIRSSNHGTARDTTMNSQPHVPGCIVI